MQTTISISDIMFYTARELLYNGTLSFPNGYAFARCAVDSVVFLVVAFAGRGEHNVGWLKRKISFP